MNIDTKTDTMNFDTNALLGKGQVVVECDIDTENRGGLSKILSVTADARCNKVDIFDDEARVQGKIAYKVLYLDRDAVLQSIEYSSDFVESLKSERLKDAKDVYAMLNIVDIDNMAKGDSIRLQAVAGIHLLGIIEDKRDIIVGVEDALVKCENLKTSTHISHINSNVDVVEDYKVGANVDRIIYSNASVCIKDIRPQKDAIEVGGDANISLLYLSDNKVATHNMTVPFSESIKCLGVDNTSTATLLSSIHSSKIIIGGVDGDNIIRVSLDVRIEGDVFDYNMQKMVSDIYSASADFEVTREDIGYNRAELYTTSDERIEGDVDIKDGEPIRKIITAIAMPNVMNNVTLKEGVADIDCLIAVDVVYISEDNKYNVIRAELPASMCIKDPMISAPDTAYASVKVNKVTTKAVRDDNIDIVLDVTVALYVMRQEMLSIITDIEKTSEKENKHKAMCVYFAKPNDDMWNIMKSTGRSEECIRRCNPNIDFDHLTHGDRVLVYGKK